MASSSSSSSSSNMTATNDFFKAAFTGNLKVLRRLMSCVSKEFATTIASAQDKNGMTALHFAASAGKTHVCKYLIEEMKLDVNVKDWKGEVPLHQAALGDQLPTAIYLLQKGADPTAADDQKMTPLHYAAEKGGGKKLLRLLISKGAVVDAEADSGTPLQFAAAHGKKEALKILLEDKANPNKIFHHLFTPLVVSILAESFECVMLLLKAGADPNIGSCGVTPLEIAASEGETEIIKCLLKAGANPNVTNHHGLSPIEVAALNVNHEDVMILFPVTFQIPSIPDWSFGGIMKHVHSDEAREQRKLKLKEFYLSAKSKGSEAFKRKDYLNAIYWYSEAIHADPIDASVLSNRSMCWARLNEGSRALSDAQTCLRFSPDWPKAYYRQGVAWNLLKKYHKAAESFHDGLKLDPNNKELEAAFGEAVVLMERNIHDYIGKY